MNELVPFSLWILLIFLKRDKFHDHKISTQKWKCFSNVWFWILKELVITVGNKSISINTPFSFWNHLNKRPWCPEGHNFLKNQMNLLITLSQLKGHKIPDLEISSRILRKSGNKKIMSFRRKLIVGNLVCIKTCYSFKPTKPFQRPKTQVPRSWYFEIPLIDALGHVDRKLPISREPFEP